MRQIRLLLAVLLALGVSTPAVAQFKKLKDAVNKAADQKAATPESKAGGQSAATAGAAPTDGGVVVLTPEVVDRLLTGAKAAKAEREKAEKEDTPYGRYHRAKAAYEVAQPKCSAAQMTWGQRAATDEKLMNQYSAAVDKAMAAQQKGDMIGYEARTYEALAIMDPSCGVREAKVPEDYNDMQRAVEERANEARRKATGFTDREDGLANDRVLAILNGSDVPGGASASEKSAVSAKKPELKAMYGIRDAQSDRVAKQAPAADTAPPPPAQVQVQAPGAKANQCIVDNVQKHEKEIQALGERGAAAQEAGNTALMMAISDTLMRLQMGGCSR
jgi:hypothetical protein